jgi:hypothetical protein
MKFKMGSSKDDTKNGTRGSGLHDSTSTSTASRSSTGTGSNSSARMNSNSGIYDVSRMTNIKSPVDPFGHNVSYFTKIRGEDAEKREKSKSETVRVILIALAVPMIAGAIYLAVSGQSLNIPGLTPESDETMPPSSQTAALESTGDRSPAAKATLPAILPLEVAPQPPGIAIVTQDGHGTTNESAAPQTLKIVLDSNGIMVSPYSVELDENGDEVARTELRDRLVYLPSLPLGQFESAPVLSKAEVPSTYTNNSQNRVFVFSEEERRRVAGLRAVAPEVKKYLNEEDSLSTSRLSIATQSVVSFTAGPNLQQARIDDMYAELKWMRAASLARDISGDRSVERRLMDSLMALAKTYKPTGSPVTELPLLDALFAYDHVRHLWRTPDQAIIDGFFRDIVDMQFTRIKSEKVYTEVHAAHVLFALSVGYVIQNSAFQLHGITQYKAHIERSKLFSLESYGPEDVRTLNALLRSAYVIERSGNLYYQSVKLYQAAGTLATASQAETKLYLLKTLGVAAYFRPDLYPHLAALTRNAGIANSRFGSGEGALLAASRHATASLLPSSAINRLPTNTVPTKLPPKRK